MRQGYPGLAGAPSERSAMLRSYAPGQGTKGMVHALRGLVCINHDRAQRNVALLRARPGNQGTCVHQS
jgi:hypothetical protein